MRELTSNPTLHRLQARVGELGGEIEATNVNLTALHKQKNIISKNLKSRLVSLQEQKKKVQDVQLMKFGKEIDIDELAEKADQSYANTIELEIEELGTKFRNDQARLVRDEEKLTDRLVQITKENTELMRTIAAYTQSKLEIGRELNHARIESTGDTRSADLAEKAERDKIASFVKHQEREIMLMKNEIALLNRKDVQQSLPYVPATTRSQTAPSKDSTPLLPPIATVFPIQQQQRPKSNYRANTKSAR